MFDGQGGGGGEAFSAGDLTGLLARLSIPTPDVTDAQRIDVIRALEGLKAAVAAAQVRQVAAFAASQEAEQEARGVRAEELGRGVAGQVGLAMRASHRAARRFTGLSRVLVRELPHTLAALEAGLITQRRALLVAQHTIWLSREDREAVDAEIAGRLPSWGDRRVETEVRKRAYERDKAGSLARQARAETDRRVSVRPAPDTMAYLTALLPVASAVACQVKLQAAADALRAAGDERSRGQIMADLLVDAITGRTPMSGIPTRGDLADAGDLADLHPEDLTENDQPDDGEPDAPEHDAPESGDAPASGGVLDRLAGFPAGTGVEIKLVMGAEALFGGSDEPAHLQGYGPVSAGWVRALLRRHDPAVRVWLRRVFTTPDGSALAGMESRRREFTGALRELIIARDQFCRMPWCGAPIRHVDHARRHADGGPTSLGNGNGLCEACNYAKEAPGWNAEPAQAPGGGGHVIRINTPTGHHYTSRAPDPPGRTRHPTGAKADAVWLNTPSTSSGSVLEIRLAHALAGSG
jgi:hypothetical protein